VARALLAPCHMETLGGHPHQLTELARQIASLARHHRGRRMRAVVAIPSTWDEARSEAELHVRLERLGAEPVSLEIRRGGVECRVLAYEFDA
jgi:hypothetical protein